MALLQHAVLPEPAIAPFVFFFLAVALTSWLCGRLPGLLAVLLAAMTANYFFITPHDAFTFSGPPLVATVLFLAAASAVALLCGAIRQGVLDMQRALAEQERVEGALRVERDFTAAVLDTAGALVIVLDRQRRITRFNHACEKVTGYQAAEVSGRCFDFMIPPDQLPEVIQAWNSLLSGDFPETHENHWMAKDGSRRLIAWSNTAIVRPNGEVDHIIGTGIDITERNLAEAALRASEERYRSEVARLRAVLDAAPTIIWTAWDAGCREITGNRAAYEFSRVPAGLDLSKTGPGAAHLEHYRIFRDGAELRAEEMPIQVVARSGRAITDDALDFAFNDGSVRSVIGNVEPVLDANGAPAGAVAAFVDVTESKRAEEKLRESERRFRELAEALPQIVFDLEADGSRGYFNRNWNLYTGREPEDIDRRFELVHPDDRARVQELWAQALISGSVYECEYRFRRHDGEYRWHLSRALPVRGAGGRVARWFGTLTDIHAIKQAQEELRIADQRKNDFLAVLSHELRNPLAPIGNGLFILEHAAPGGEEARNAQTIIDRQVRHLTRIVDDLLDLTRIGKNKIRLQRARLELNDLACRTIQDHRPLFEGRGVTLTFEPASSPLYVDGDPSRLGQSLGNLLQNAVKFTGPGGRVAVSLSSDPLAGRAVLRVADNGVGIRPEILPRLFEPFMQADTTLDRSTGGLGLGLALVKGICELHGGEVTAHSAGPGQGAEFVIHLPLDVTTPARLELKRAPAVTPRRRVLIIEDNEDAATSLRMLLELSRHQVAVAYDGPEGIAKARDCRPEVLLCDIGLPGMNGYEVARAFRDEEALQDTFLVALSGYALPEDVRRAADAGFDAHMAKPPNLEKLHEILANLPRRR